MNCFGKLGVTVCIRGLEEYENAIEEWEGLGLFLTDNIVRAIEIQYPPKQTPPPK